MPLTVDIHTRVSATPAHESAHFPPCGVVVWWALSLFKCVCLTPYKSYDVNERKERDFVLRCFPSRFRDPDWSLNKYLFGDTRKYRKKIYAQFQRICNIFWQDSAPMFTLNANQHLRGEFYPRLCDRVAAVQTQRGELLRANWTRIRCWDLRKSLSSMIKIVDARTGYWCSVGLMP